MLCLSLLTSIDISTVCEFLNSEGQIRPARTQKMVFLDESRPRFPREAVLLPGCDDDFVERN